MLIILNLQFQEISIPPWKVIENISEGEGGGISKANALKGQNIYKANVEKGGGGIINKKDYSIHVVFFSTLPFLHLFSFSFGKHLMFQEKKSWISIKIKLYLLTTVLCLDQLHIVSKQV